MSNSWFAGVHAQLFFLDTLRIISVTVGQKNSVSQWSLAFHVSVITLDHWEHLITATFTPPRRKHVLMPFKLRVFFHKLRNCKALEIYCCSQTSMHSHEDRLGKENQVLMERVICLTSNAPLDGLCEISCFLAYFERRSCAENATAAPFQKCQRVASFPLI